MRKCVSLIWVLILSLCLCACGQKETPTTWQEQYDLGVRYLSEGNYEEAIIAFTAAIEIDPKNVDAHLALADVYVALGNIDKAQEILEAAIEMVDDMERIKLEIDRLNEADSEVGSTVESELGIDHGQADELQITNTETEPTRDAVPPEERLTSDPEIGMSQLEGQNDSLAQTEPESTPATEGSSTVDSGALNGGDITWNIDNTGLLSVGGNGELAQYNKNTNLAPWNAYTESIKQVVISDGLTGLGSWGFSDCKSLTDITIANTVSSIGPGTFSGCRRLTNIILPSGLENVEKSLFAGCSSLKTVVIPKGVQQIYDMAFHNCKSLTGIEIPDGVTDIRSSAFAGCEALTHITIPTSTTFIGEYAFANCNALIDVYYQGTSAEWDVITIRNGNDALTGATIHFQG